MIDQFQAALSKIRSLEGENPRPDFMRYYALFGEVDAAFERMELGYQINGKDVWDRREHFWPFYWALENDPRWQLFLEKTGVSESQLSEFKFDVLLPKE